MAEGQADRTILFKLKPIVDESSMATFRQFQSMAEQVQRNITGAQRGPGGDGQAKSDREAVRREMQADRERLRQEKEADRRLEQSYREESKRQRQAERDLEKSYREEARRQQQQDRQFQREMAAAAREDRRKEIVEEREANKAVRDAKKTRTVARRADSRFRESVSGTVDSAIGFAEGLATYGLADEQTVEGIVRGFVKIRGAVETLRSGIGIFRGIAESVETYRKAVDAAAVANRALAAAQAAGAAGRVAGGVSAGAGAAGAAGAAGGGPGMAATLSALSTGVLALPGAIAAAVAGVAAAGTMAFNIGGSRDWATQRMLGKGSEESGPSWFQRNAANSWVGEGASWLTFGDTGGRPGSGSVAQQARDAIKQADESKKRTERMQIAAEEANIRREARRADAAADIQAQRDLANLDQEGAVRGIQASYRRRGLREGQEFTYGQAAAARQELMAESNRNRQAMLDQKAAGRFASSPGQQAQTQAEMDDLRRRQADIRERDVQARMDERRGARSLSLVSERDRRIFGERQGNAETLGNRTDRLIAAGPGNDREDYDRQVQTMLTRTAEARQQEVDAARQRLADERQIAQQKIQGAEASLRRSQEEVQVRQQIIDTEKNRLKSAEERFGEADPYEQRRLIGLMQRARGGGNLTTQEWKDLQAVGTRETEGRASAEFRRRAEQAGFRDVFGQEETRRIQQAEREKREFEVKVKEDRQIKVKLEEDVNALADKIASQIDQAMADRDQRLAQLVERRLAEERDRTGREMQQRLNNLRNPQRSP